MRVSNAVNMLGLGGECFRTFGTLPRVLFFTKFGLCLDPDAGQGGGGGAGAGQGDGSSGGQGAGQGQGGEGDGDGAQKGKVKLFTQAELDRVVAKQRRDLQEKHLDEVNKLRKSQNLTDEQRADLEKRASELEDALLTEQEKAKKEIQRIQKEHEDMLNAMKERAEANWQLYADARLSAEITTAASKHKAFNPTQIDAIIRPLATIEEDKDEKLKPLGTFSIKVKAMVKDKEGKMEEKALTVDEYVAHMRESSEYFNLFVSDRPGGSGYRPGGKGGGANGSALSPTQKIAEGLRQLR